jgi:carboxyl-terminal processing protease
VRETIQPHTVFARRLGEDKKVGYLRVSEFAEATHGEFDRELDALVAAGVRAVIVDLRDNTGGVLLTTERMADRFLRSGVIVRTKGRTRDSSKTVVASEPDTVPDAIGLAVIVNGSSASASEVFAGCVQDHRRGVLVGTRTFGKFLVQNITEIPGKGAAVKVTTAKYMTPLGRWYQRNPKDPDAAAGLVPDVVVELTDDEQTRLRKSFESQDKLAWGTALEPTDVPPDWVDPQVERALEILSGKVVLQEIRTGEKRNG